MGCDHKPSGILWDDADAFGVFRRVANGFGNLRDFGGGREVAVSAERQQGASLADLTAAFRCCRCRTVPHRTGLGALRGHVRALNMHLKLSAR